MIQTRARIPNKCKPHIFKYKGKWRVDWTGKCDLALLVPACIYATALTEKERKQ